MRADYMTTVLAQPESLRTSAQSLRSQLSRIDPAPWRAGTLGVVGMGASAHAAHVLVALLTRHGRRAVATPAAAYLQGPGPQADCYLLVSESGESVETVRAAEALRGAPRLGLTNVPDSPLAAEVDAHLDLECGLDSAVYTIGYTATLQAFALIAEWIGVSGEDVDVSGLTELGAEVIDASRSESGWPVRELLSARSIDVVGHGIHYASAAETALMVRETCRLPSSCHDTFEYLHGPMEWLEPGSACIVFGAGREIELAEFVGGTGATTLLVTDAEARPEGVHVVPLPKAGAAVSVLLEALPVHVLLQRMASSRGLSIDGFRYHQDDRKLSSATGEVRGRVVNHR